MSLFEKQKKRSTTCALSNNDREHGSALVCVDCYHQPLAFVRSLIDRLVKSKKIDTEGIVEILKADKELGLGLLGQTYDDIYQAGFNSGVRSVNPMSEMEYRKQFFVPARHWNAREYQQLINEAGILGGIGQVIQMGIDPGHIFFAHPEGQANAGQG